MINFYLKNDRIAFEINLRTVRSTRIEISSRLLKLARITGEKP
jgi:hypothetical protein